MTKPGNIFGQRLASMVRKDIESSVHDKDNFKVETIAAYLYRSLACNLTDFYKQTLGGERGP